MFQVITGADPAAGMRPAFDRNSTMFVLAQRGKSPATGGPPQLAQSSRTTSDDGQPDDARRQGRLLEQHPLDDDVAAIRFGQAQRAEIGRDDVAERRLIAGEVATLAFPLTRSPSFSRGYTVQLEVERELDPEIKELS
jgi:hypothetical protein